MWGVVSRDVRGPVVHRGSVAAVPIVRTRGVRMGPPGGRWGWAAMYSLPAVEVSEGDGEPDLVVLPDVGLWVRIAAALLVAVTIFSLGGRRCMNRMR